MLVVLVLWGIFDFLEILLKEMVVEGCLLWFNILVKFIIVYGCGNKFGDVFDFFN